MNVRILMVGVSGIVLAACSGAPGSSTGSSTVDGVKGSLGSAAGRSHDGGRDQSGDDDDGHKADAASCKAPDGGRSPCAQGDDDDDNGGGDEHKADAASCKAPDGGRSPCAQGDDDDDDSGDMGNNGDDEGRKDGGGRRDGGDMN